ncbi:MAG: 4-hydroxyphenylacetate 3-hydroxylase N-terminal domain-containing protein [Candidatus Thermoplasmatota archaeon]|jgi:4-hydroxybutyryl-CoA dehydratase/vinylacetyl-CoA-Delta-isomerase|nr:4-hydroxyphenylacetate 3-hydroxylase N-terminal domain-containing protein [Candidatus Thermoplasmatota archaeon]
MRTPEEYKKSLRQMRPNVYKFGELIKDVTTHPATRRTVEGHAQIFAASLKPEYQDILTTKSSLTGERVSRYLSILGSAEDMFANLRMKRLMFNLTGTCTGGRCAGFNAINAMWATTYDMDQDLGTDYHKRLQGWLKDAQKKDITLSGALTDPKGDRSKTPTQQNDPDLSLHVVDKNDEGIVVRGAKVMICGVAAANEVFVMPGTGYKEPDKDYAVSFAIPRDAENLTVVETRRPSDNRELEEGFDIPVEMGGITQAYLLFDDVFVPKERVFMCGEYDYTTRAVMNFIAPYRSAIGGCVAGQGDVMVGAAALMARANGLSEKVFREKITQMVINNETTFGMGIAASALGKKHPSGVWIPDMLLSNVNKVHVATLPYETKRITQDIAGGIAETGCLPSCKDLNDLKYGKMLKKYLKANCDGETRARIARLIEWLTIGAGVPGCMHGGGSPDGAKLVISSKTDIEHYIELAKRIADIKEDIRVESKKK